IRIDLFAQIAWQEPEPLAGFHSGARQDAAIDFLASEPLRRIGDRKPGLAGAGGSDAEHQLVALQRADIGILRSGARAHWALAQVDGLELRLRRLGVVFE